ncbi:cytochrome P450 [Aspergillus avenaceus]|uniref:Cytochrome P450 n=1 Tax=Aspergillus avenaceus TaxID=36643 RepID=A0A5N6TXC4_ASPAV|nr:cytochrome P450 [Aspergillus avenaceus]
MDSYIYIYIVLLIPLALYCRSNPIPTVNAYPGDITQSKARAAFFSDARALLSQGIARFNGPFRITTNLGSRVILPSSWANWVTTRPELDHAALIREEYFADYPGMEAQAVLQEPTKFMAEVIKTKLNQSSQCKLMRDHAVEAVQELWTSDSNWHAVDLSDMIRIIARVSSVVFVGPDLARNPVWQDLIVTYTVNYFNGVRALRSWPSFLRPLVHWFLPECRKCREQVRLGQRLMEPILEQRKHAKAEGRTFHDSIEWFDEAATQFDPAAAQLGLAIGALHTTTELVRQGLVDILQHPELIQTIRDEARQADESGWTTAGVYKMQLLDSALKETLRLKPGMLVGLERKAVKPLVLPNGVTLPKGSKIGVECSMMWDERSYDAYRFLRQCQSGDPAALASTSPRHVAFGIGRSACPGRFFAANEAKIILATLFLAYDVRLVGESRVQEMGFEMRCDPATTVEVRNGAFSPST